MPTKKTPSRRRLKRRSWAWRYRRVLLLFGLMLLTGAAGVAFVLTRVPLPPPPDLHQTTILTDAGGQRLAELHGAENRVTVTLDRVPRVLRQAVIATEDRTFFRHNGVDPVGVVRATWADVRNKGYVQGGSTITQQYVKNTYVGRERTLWRKLKEAVISVKLERKLGKDEILERYLNTIYFGRGAYGVQAASQAYFGKDVDQLGLKEASYLAGLIRSPNRADVVADRLLAARRRHLTLLAMQRDRYISPAQRADTEQVPLEDYVRAPPAVTATVARGDKGTQYFVEYVRRYLSRRYGDRAVYGGGLRVRTALDLKLQADAYDAVYGLLNRARDPSGALVALDDEGRVRAMVGGKDWNLSKVNLAVGREGGGRGRQGGSAFKPFVLATAVAKGYTVESSFPGPPSIVLPKANDGKDWHVSNYEGEGFGRLNLVDATRNSVNTVYAQVVTKIGPTDVVAMAHRMGVHSSLQPVPSITLGTQDVSVLEMAESYLTLASRGMHVQPQVVLEVRTADGQVIERNRPRPARVLDKAQADTVNFVLRQVVERGTGTNAAFGKPFAGKTGTSQDYGDAWFVGYTPRLTAAVWMGYPEGQSRQMLNVHGRKVNGGSFPAAIFRRFMAVATRGVDTGTFPAPPSRFPGKVLSGDRIRFVVPPPTPSSAPPSRPTATTSPGAPSTSVPPTTATVAPPTTSPPVTRPPAPPTTAPVVPATTVPPG